MPPPDELHHPNCQTDLPVPHHVAEVREVYPELVEHHKRLFREAQGLPDDAEVAVLFDPDDPTRMFLYQPGTFIRLEGGTLDVVAYWSRRRRAVYRLQRAWGWLRYGWRWW